MAAEKANKARPQPSVERIEVDTDSYPAEGDLLAHFRDEAAARNFAAGMTAQSSRAMNYLWAMRRLKGQFSASQIEKLTPEARANVPLSNSRIARNQVLYANGTGLVDLAALVKKYVKSLYGSDSPQFKQISGLEFTRPR